MATYIITTPVQPKKVILVTGSSSGFGRLTVETLARQGHNVYATMRDVHDRNAKASVELMNLAKVENLSLQVVELDVTDDASAEGAVERVIQQAGRIDVLVNNAGAVFLGPTETFTVEQVRQQLDTNFFGIVRMNRAVLPHMRRQGSGLLVYISSILGRLVLPFAGAYNASKFAVEGLAETYRYELSSLGIDSVIVEPGVFPTSIFSKATTPADSERVAGYQILAPIEEQISARVQETLSGSDAPNSQDVADVVARLIATPAGQRPLRTLVGQDVQLATQLNQAAEQTQASWMEQWGMASLMVLSPQERLVA
jgi:NAD(P)-dependent dehydrogenase (short-subunit alcohol dehydrogenase family)